MSSNYNYFKKKYQLPSSRSSLTFSFLPSLSIPVNVTTGDNSNNVPLLDAELNDIYNNLNSIEKSLFRKCYIRLWQKVYNYSTLMSDTNIITYLWLVPDLMRHTRRTWRELCVLLKLWQLTVKGKHAIRSTTRLWINSERIILRALESEGVVERYSRDPFMAHSRHYPQKCYIILTEKGINTIKQILIIYKQIIINYHLQIAELYTRGVKKTK